MALLGAVLLAALAVNASASATQAGPCGYATFLRDDLKDAERATNEYLRLLRANPDLNCARAGLLKLRDAAASARDASLCNHPSTLLRLGKTEAAETAFLEILKERPGALCASGGLTQVRGTRCRAAVDLLDRGQWAKAKSLAEGVRESHPRSGCAAAVLDRVERQKPKRELATEIKDDFTFWAPLAALGAAAFLALLAALFNYRPLRRRVARIPGVRRVFPVRLTIGAFDAVPPTKADGFASLVRARLYELRANGERAYGVDGVTGYEGFGKTLADLGDIASQFKVAGAIVSRLTAAFTSRFTLVGTRRDSTAGPVAGASLALEERGSLLASADLWLGKYGAAAPSVDDLALVVGAWSDQELADAHARRARRVFDGNSQSRAFVACASLVEDRDAPLAAFFCELANQADPSNAQAAIRTALLLARRGDYSEAILILQRHWERVEALT